MCICGRVRLFVFYKTTYALHMSLCLIYTVTFPSVCTTAVLTESTEPSRCRHGRPAGAVNDNDGGDIDQTCGNQKTYQPTSPEPSSRQTVGPPPATRGRRHQQQSTGGRQWSSREISRGIIGRGTGLLQRVCLPVHTPGEEQTKT